MEKERYVVLPEVRPLIDGNMQAHRLFVGMNLHDAVFIWPVRLPDGINDGGRTWSESALICADQAKSMWIKIRGNRSAGAYEKQVAEGKLDEPKWPVKSFTDLVSEAYKGKVVDRPDHPVIRKLSGDRSRPVFGLPFQQVWLLDTEYISESGGRPLPSCIPVCLVARELNSNRLIRLWQDQLGSEPPFPVGDDSLFVCFQAAAEWSFFLAVGWPLPTRVLDLYVKNLHRTNDGRPRAKGTTKLLAALRDHGISSITSEEKTEMRDLVLRGGPWSSIERRQILDYCQTDVDPLAALLERMLPFIRSHPEGLAQAMIRGRSRPLRPGLNAPGFLSTPNCWAGYVGTETPSAAT